MKLKILFYCVLLCPIFAQATKVYHCKTSDGHMAFQDQPCEGETVKVQASENRLNNKKFKHEMIQALARLTGKTPDQLANPEIRKAAEALAATDAAKSYAFTKVYAVSAKYCDASVKRKLNDYKKSASDIITLGQYYYNNGIQLAVKGKDLGKSGAELTTALNGMTDKLDREFRDANAKQLKSKCRDASRALDSLIMVYGRN